MTVPAIASPEITTNVRPTPVLAWIMLGFTTVCGVLAFALFPLTINTELPGGWAVTNDPLAAWINALQSTLIVPLTASVFGFIIVKRQAGNRIGWLLMLLGVAASLNAFGGYWAIYGYFTAEQPLPSAQFAGWVTNWMWIILFSILFILLGVFPTGTYLSRRWRAVLLTSLALFALPLLFAATIETPMTSAFQMPNSFVSVHPEKAYGLLFTLGVPFMPITAILTLIEILRRFHRAVGVERQQMKWLMAGVALMVAMVVVGLILGLRLGNPVGDIMVNISALAPLTGIGIAMFRHRLYDIDVIIRRTLVYSLITGMLLLIYFGSVILLQRLFGLITGQQSTLAIVLSTLLIAALFNPLRRHTQRLIERRFYRRRYNAERVLERFAQASRNEVDLGALEVELAAVVRETMLPASVSIWINRTQE